MPRNKRNAPYSDLILSMTPAYPPMVSPPPKSPPPATPLWAVPSPSPMLSSASSPLPSPPQFPPSVKEELRSVRAASMFAPSPAPSFSKWQAPSPDGEMAQYHHTNYYLEDGVVFRVWGFLQIFYLINFGWLARVPRYMLVQESEIFMESYLLPNTGKGAGNSDNNPINLTGIQCKDFEHLLAILYPRSIMGHGVVTDTWKEEEWLSILQLATIWQMPNLRQLAIEQLSSQIISPITKISLGREYKHSLWIRDGLLELCLRDDSLTEEEGSRLEWKEIIKIAMARERIRSQVLSVSYEPTYADTKYGQCLVYQKHYSAAGYYKHMMVHDILEEVFELDPENMTSALVSRPSSPL
ncbi:hypothetical protein K439DRAFT_1617767 [Ramaria rubella]|nr:hypothetical protein K439DRAFT_1617767 [Ramaria rubella]